MRPYSLNPILTFDISSVFSRNESEIESEIAILWQVFHGHDPCSLVITVKFTNTLQQDFEVSFNTYFGHGKEIETTFALAVNSGLRK